jgi:capsular polysaccharide transport system permease protein
MLAELQTIPVRRSRAEVYFQVLYALILRDMRTRFGGSHLGFSVAVLWPVAHVFVLVVILTFRNLPSPMGGGTALFIATGAVPCLAFQYISREVMKGYAANKPLTYYPQVKIFDVILSRIIVEIVSGFMGVIAVMSLLAVSGVDPRPDDTFMAVSAYLAALLLGIGFGVINVGIVAFFPAWQIGYIFFTILNYMLAGVVFMPNYMPSEVYYYLRFNPVTQIIEWMRVAYEPHLAIEIDYVYILLWILATITIGYLMERFVVRKMG